MIQWLKLDCEVVGAYRPSFFVGSMLRGVLGHALKRVVCINPNFQCEGCFATDSCLFYDFYEKKNTTHRYRLGIGLKPSSLNFSLYLFEDAIGSLPYVLSAILKAFEEMGVGEEQKKMRIGSITCNGELLYDGNSFANVSSVVPNELEIDTFCQNVILQFTMPLRIKQNNSIAGSTVELHTLVNNIQRRYRILKKLPPEKLGYRVRGAIVESSMKFVETQRYSNRQKSRMNLGGLVGSMRIEGLDKQSYMYFKIGEIIGVGKQTVFGLGSYHILE